MRKLGERAEGDAEFFRPFRGEQTVVPDGLVVDDLVSEPGRDIIGKTESNGIISPSFVRPTRPKEFITSWYC